MKEKVIKDELGLGVRAFIEAINKSKEKSVDEFDELRILETAFNRLFMAVEHVSNALVLFETGNISTRHFGDIKKLEKIKEKYNLPDIPKIYDETYRFRVFGDYRKRVDVKPDFNKQSLENKIKEVKRFIENTLKILSKRIDIEDIKIHYDRNARF